MTVTKQGLKWKIRNSLWIIWSFIPLFNGIGMLYAGLKVKVYKWSGYGLIYLAITWAPILFIKEFNTDVGILLFFINYLVCIIHSFKIRQECLLRIEILKDLGAKNAKQAETDISEEQVDKVNEITNMEKPAYSSINKDNDALMTEKSAVSPKIPNLEELNKKVLLDINSCTEDELAELPGVGLILAKEAIKIRSQKGSFASVDEFIEKLNVNSHYVARIREMICCGTAQANKKPEAFKVKGRMVDY